MNYQNSSSPSTAQCGAEPDHARLRHVLDALNVIRENVTSSRNRLTSAMDNVLGSSPTPECKQAGIHPPACCLADEIRQTLFSIAGVLNELQDEVNRVERIAT